jgi:hypothetical protein
MLLLTVFPSGCLAHLWDAFERGILTANVLSGPR